MDQAGPHNEEDPTNVDEAAAPFDYTFVSAVSRIALYDDLLSAPHVTEILPAETSVYIENLAAKVYELAKNSGGAIPYTVIREVSENFIHARFKEIIISILDHGNTIRFADQGPGINHKDRAQLPGFSSAVEPMKKYIRGVGSGLPIVKEYLEFSHGNITIEDNLGAGSVVTISLDPERSASAGKSNAQPSQAQGPDQGINHAQPTPAAYSLEGAYSSPEPIMGTGAQNGAWPAQGLMGQEAMAGLNHQPNPQNGMGLGYQGAPYQQPCPNQPYGTYAAAPQAMGYTRDPLVAAQYAAHEASRIQMAIAPLSQKERDFLTILLSEGALGVRDISKLTDTPESSTFVALKKLEEAGLVEKNAAKKRALTPIGQDVARSLQ